MQLTKKAMQTYSNYFHKVLEKDETGVNIFSHDRFYEKYNFC